MIAHPLVTNKLYKRLESLESFHSRRKSFEIFTKRTDDKFAPTWPTNLLDAKGRGTGETVQDLACRGKRALTVSPTTSWANLLPRSEKILQDSGCFIGISTRKHNHLSKQAGTSTIPFVHETTHACMAQTVWCGTICGSSFWVTFCTSSSHSKTPAIWFPVWARKKMVSPTTSCWFNWNFNGPATPTVILLDSYPKQPGKLHDRMGHGPTPFAPFDDKFLTWPSLSIQTAHLRLCEESQHSTARTDFGAPSSSSFTAKRKPLLLVKKILRDDAMGKQRICGQFSRGLSPW